MVKKSLECEEICRIIKACGDCGVTSLKFGGLILELGGVTSPYHIPEPMADAALSETQSKIGELSLKEQIARHKQDRLELMLIEDPVEAERLITSGEIDLEEETDGSEEA